MNTLLKSDTMNSAVEGDFGVVKNSLENDVTKNSLQSFDEELLCDDTKIPSAYDYMLALDGWGIGMLVYAVLAFTIITCICLSTMRHVLKYGNHKTTINFILSAYPAVSATLVAAMAVPRCRVLAEALGQCIYAFSMYQLFCLFLAYCGGESALVRSTKPDSLNLKVGPCCCYPCCVLPVYTPNKKNVRYLRFLVLQLPIVHSIGYAIYLFAWSDNKDHFLPEYFIQPIIVCSILVAAWGMIMTVKMLASRVVNHFFTMKFLSLQSIVLLTKLQGVIVRIMLATNALPCYPPLTPALYATIVFNSIVLFEFILICFWARSLYTRSNPDSNDQENDPKQICQVQALNIGGKQIDLISSSIISTTQNNNYNTMCYDNQNLVIDVKM